MYVTVSNTILWRPVGEKWSCWGNAGRVQFLGWPDWPRLLKYWIFVRTCKCLFNVNCHGSDSLYCPQTFAFSAGCNAVTYTTLTLTSCPSIRWGPPASISSCWELLQPLAEFLHSVNFTLAGVQMRFSYWKEPKFVSVIDWVLTINRGISFSSLTTPMPCLLRLCVRPAIVRFPLFQCFIIEELCNLYSSPNRIRMIKSKRWGEQGM